MPLEFLYVSRIQDGLVLVASLDQQQQQPQPSATAQGLRARQPAKPGGEAQEGKNLLLSLNASSPARCSVEGESLCYHYAIQGPIVVFAATDKQYPKKLAFAYLEEARRLFWEHVARENPGADPARVVMQTDRPYAFIKFDRELRNLRRDFADPGSRKNMQRLQENLVEIQSIMRKNIDDLVQRGTALDDIRSASQKLHEDSKSLAWGAKKLNRMAMLRRYGPIAGVFAFVLFFMWIRFYVML